MSFLKKMDKMLAGFGNVKAMKKTHKDTYTEERINNVQGEQFGIGEFGELWIDFQELGGFNFLNTTIISATNFNTKKGTKLAFQDKEFSFEFNSDELIIESDYSNISDRYITKIDYPVNENELGLVKKRSFQVIKFTIENDILLFNLD